MISRKLISKFTIRPAQRRHVQPRAILIRASLFSLAILGYLALSGHFHILDNTAAAQSDSAPADPAWTLSPAPANAVQFHFKLKGYVLGLRMIKADYEGFYTPTHYDVRAKLRTSGLAALLKKLRIWAHTSGRLDRSGLYPVQHVQQNEDKKNRRVEMDYDYSQSLVSVGIKPPLGSQGVPPASPLDRFSADDTLSAVLNLMLGGQKLDSPLCSGGVRVFDSKQHYNLRMVAAGTKVLKFKGERVETLRCHVFYEPLSGFDPEDLPEEHERNTPVKVYFKTTADNGLHIPLRFTYKISGFKAVIKVTNLQITGLEG